MSDAISTHDPTCAQLIEHTRNAIFHQNRDGLWIVDCTAKSEWGTVGEGKSNFTFHLAKEFQQPPDESDYPKLALASGLSLHDVRTVFDDIPAFDPKWQTIYRDEYGRFIELVRTLSPGMVIVWEEIETGLARKVPYQHRRPIIQTFQEMRKLGLMVIGNCPRVMDLDEYLIFDRIQKVWRMLSRTKCDVYVRNGFVNPKKDLWGERQGVIDEITAVHPLLWREYEADAMERLHESQMGLVGVGR
jgi:hypothetical protein